MVEPARFTRHPLRLLHGHGATSFAPSRRIDSVECPSGKRFLAGDAMGEVVEMEYVNVQVRSLRRRIRMHSWARRSSGVSGFSRLARYFGEATKTAYAVHPGVVATNLARNLGPVPRRVLTAMGPLVLKSVGEGAATEVFARSTPRRSPWRAATSPIRTRPSRAPMQKTRRSPRGCRESEKIVQALGR